MTLPVGLLALTLLLSGGQPETLLLRSRWYLDHRHINRAFLDSAFTVAARARAFNPWHEATAALHCHLLMESAGVATNRSDRIRLLLHMQAVAESLRQRHPAGAEGHYCWATATAQLGLARPSLAALRTLPEVRRAYGRALEINPNHVGALYGQAMLWAGPPRFAGGNPERADSLLQQAIALDPHLTMLRVARARLLIKAKRRAEARAELSAVMHETSPSVPAAYWLNDRQAARTLLQELEELR